MSDAVMNAGRARKPGGRRRVTPTTPDPIELAMEAEAAGEAPPQSAAQRILERQAHLIGWQIASERASFALKILTAVTGIIVAVVIALMLWSASQYRGLVVQPFSVPPELEARGLTGSAVATRLLDKLGALQDGTVSLRAANTFANSWGDDVEVEIPQTGVSAGELWRFLRSWLGEEVKITGEVVRTPEGLQITARAGGHAAPVFSGSEAELEALLDQAAEAIYARTQPYRYAIYLERAGREAESLAALEALSRSGNETDRKWALSAWNLRLQAEERYDEAIDKASAAIALDPRFGLAYANRGGAASGAGRAEQAYQDTRTAERLFHSSSDVDREQAEAFSLELRAQTAASEHDYAAAARLLTAAVADGGDDARGLAFFHAMVLAARHDLPQARGLMAGARAPDGWMGPFDTEVALGFAFAIEDWPAVVRENEVWRAAVAGDRAALVYWNYAYRPAVAMARARIGDLAGAEALLAGVSNDSYWVVIARGQLAAIKGDIPASERWFALAARQAPSLADAELVWGRARLERGDHDGAIVQFRAAARKSPRWADPLKFHGDALAAEGDLRGAIAKYRAALRLAPEWGALHLALGRALERSGQREAALASYRTASAKDLSPVDRAELARRLRAVSSRAA
jgi:tetratricopeptide (TPR) repeat protein